MDGKETNLSSWADGINDDDVILISSDSELDVVSPETSVGKKLNLSHEAENQMEIQGECSNYNSNKIVVSEDYQFYPESNEEIKKNSALDPKVPPLKIKLACCTTCGQSRKTRKRSRTKEHLAFVISSNETDNEHLNSGPKKLKYRHKKHLSSSERVLRSQRNKNSSLDLIESTSTLESRLVLNESIQPKTQERIDYNLSHLHDSRSKQGNALEIENKIVKGAEELQLRKKKRPLQSDSRKNSDKVDEQFPSKSSTTNSFIETVKISSASENDQIEEELKICFDQKPKGQFLTSFESFINIRKQVHKKRMVMKLTEPNLPKGYADYLMNRRSYILEQNATIYLPKMQDPPNNLHPAQIPLFISQENERQKLFVQHMVEKQKLILSVEMEIMRVHCKATRAVENQPRPFSACTFLLDEEIYSPLDLTNVNKPYVPSLLTNDSNRYRLRNFLNWLKELDDKWDKIKKDMLLRHQCEAQCLQAVQLMFWRFKMQEIGQFNVEAMHLVDVNHVPRVDVCPEFDLIPK